MTQNTKMQEMQMSVFVQNSHIWGLRPHYARPSGMGGFRASWRGGTLSKKSSFVSIPASCSEGHFFEDCVWKDTLHYLWKNIFQKFEVRDVLYKLSPINF